MLTVVFAGRSPGTLRVALLPWPLVVFASGLFLAVGVLATLLWHERLRAVGVEVPWGRYVLAGLVAAPLIVAGAVVPLALR